MQVDDREHAGRQAGNHHRPIGQHTPDPHRQRRRGIVWLGGRVHEPPEDREHDDREGHAQDQPPLRDQQRRHRVAEADHPVWLDRVARVAAEECRQQPSLAGAGLIDQPQPAEAAAEREQERCQPRRDPVAGDVLRPAVDEREQGDADDDRDEEHAARERSPGDDKERREEVRDVVVREADAGEDRVLRREVLAVGEACGDPQVIGQVAEVVDVVDRQAVGGGEQRPVGDQPCRDQNRQPVDQRDRAREGGMPNGVGDRARHVAQVADDLAPSCSGPQRHEREERDKRRDDEHRSRQPEDERQRESNECQQGHAQHRTGREPGVDGSRAIEGVGRDVPPGDCGCGKQHSADHGSLGTFGSPNTSRGSDTGNDTFRRAALTTRGGRPGARRARSSSSGRGREGRPGTCSRHRARGPACRMAGSSVRTTA